MYNCRCKPEEDRAKKLADIYKPPSNIPNLVTPRTNSDVWELLNRGHRAVDIGVQNAQNMQTHALTSIVRIVEEICNETAGPTEKHLNALMDAVRLMSMVFSACNQVRKEAIRNALGYPVARFCNWDSAVGQDTLFIDVAKKIEERDKAQYKLKRRGRGYGNYNSYR